MSQALQNEDLDLKPREDLVAEINSIVANGYLIENIDQARSLISSLKQPYHIDLVELSYQKNIIRLSARDGFYHGTQTGDNGRMHYNFTGQLQNLAEEISYKLPCRVSVYALDEKSVKNSTSWTEVAADIAKKAPKFGRDYGIAERQPLYKENLPKADKFSALTINLSVAAILAMAVFIGYSWGKNSNK